MLSIVEETIKFLKKENLSNVGIISTAITLNNKLYENLLLENNIKQVTPENFQQTKINKIIHNLVSQRHLNKDRKELIGIINDFEKKGVGHIILACTDLQLLIPKQASRLKTYDTMKIFADATVREILRD